MARHTQSGQRSLGYEVSGVVLIAVAIFLGLALLSYQPGRPQTNLVGVIGYLLADLLCSALGKMSYALPALAVYTAGLQFRLWRCTAVTSQAVSLGVFGLASTALLSLWDADRPAVYAGGWIGGWLAVSLRTGLNQLGAYLVLIPVLVVSLMGISRLSLHALGGRLLRGGRFVSDWCGVGLRPLAAWLRTLATTLWSGLHRLPSIRFSRRQGHVAEAEACPNLEPRFVASEAQARTPPPAPPVKKAASKQARKPAKQQTPPAEDQAPPPIIINRPSPPTAPKAGRSCPRPSPAAVLDDEKPYSLPGLDLLDPPLESRLKVDEEALHASSQILESKLNDFGVKGKVVAVRPGPVITTYEFEPAPGVKVNRVVSLADDLQMALRAVSVRILAPIPGKAVVGIEVSNPNREKVYLREILDSPGFQQTESPLGLALGKDSIGNPIVADLARMPHLLVAGATGTGKSVSLNAMIMSLLYRASPRDVRFIMIDPKMLELSLYENLPHQLSHVITNPKEAGAALQEVVRRMEYRYKLLRDRGARNISAYNRSLENGAPSPNGVIKLTEVVEDELDEDAAVPGLDAPAAPAPAADPHDDAMVHQRLPYLVVIVDELADLLTVGREIEEPITRLAQMGRASGIHLILATQRPSVDVITGLIKANFPARVSFQVSSRIDSRTILDAAGAERLLGAGDMLFLPPGSAKPQRIHGAFVSEPEISKAVGAIKKQAKPVFDSELVSALEKARSTKSVDTADDDTYDEMYEQARELVIESRQASISWVQRRLRVGYNRAARMIERMEREGLIAPAAEAGKPRQVLVKAAVEE